MWGALTWGTATLGCPALREGQWGHGGDAVGTLWPWWQCWTAVSSLSSREHMGRSGPKLLTAELLPLTPLTPRCPQSPLARPGWGGSTDPPPPSRGAGLGEHRPRAAPWAPMWPGWCHTCGVRSSLEPHSALGMSPLYPVSPPVPPAWRAAQLRLSLRDGDMAPVAVPVWGHI